MINSLCNNINLAQDIFLSMSKYLTDKELSKKYQMPYPTISKWKKIHLYEAGQEYKVYLIEFLRRFDKEYTLKIIDKYNLPKNISFHYVSFITGIPYEIIRGLETSKVAWKEEIFDILINHNQEFFDIQYQFVKRCVQKDIFKEDII